MNLHDRIRKRRAELNMTLEEVARTIGISRQTMSRYETGVISNIPFDKIELLASALKTTPSALMGWDELDVKEKANIKGVINMTLSEIIGLYCKEHGLSHRAFASQCGVSHAYISLLVKGVNPSTGDPITPQFGRLRLIAGGMGLTLRELLSCADDLRDELDVSVKDREKGGERVKITIEAEPEEIAALIVAIQERQGIEIEPKAFASAIRDSISGVREKGEVDATITTQAVQAVPHRL